MSRETRRAVVDVLRMRRAGAGLIGRRQRQRLAAMLTHARAHSPFYRDLYANLPRGVPDLAALPPVSKPQLMEHFDDVVTDRAVTRRGVDAFLADPANIGRPFLGRYQAAMSSGTTGHPGVFVQDELSRVVSGAMTRIRGGLTNWYGLRGALRFVRSGRRYALVDVGGGPYGALVSIAWAKRENPKLADTMRFISVMDSLDQQVAELNDFQPGALGGYPSAILLLAREQAAGRLRIRPVFIIFVGENIAGPTRRFIEAAFGCRTYEEYGSTENGVLAVQCREGWLHYSADWFVLEPVDAEYRPVPAGTRSGTVLVTNLMNRLMPIIRYDQGDSVLLKPEPCACGSAYPAMHVLGRTGDLLDLPARDGAGSVTLTPLNLATVIAETAGVYRLQVIRRAAADLEIRLETLPGADVDAVWSSVAARVRGYLDEHGVGPVVLHRSGEAPMKHPRSGKYAQIIDLDRRSPTGLSTADVEPPRG